MNTRQLTADNAVNSRVFDEEAVKAVNKIHAEADAREAALEEQALADSRYCGAAGCVRRVGESLFGKKKKTAGRRRRNRNKKGSKKTLKRSRSRR
jgi:hypothetical protein